MPAALSVDDAEPARIADELEAVGVGAPRLDGWRLPREHYRPTAHVARGADGAPVAAVLTSARPATAATKIVDLWWRDETAAEDLVAHVVAQARGRGEAAVKWQTPGGDGLPSFAAALGFVAMRRPWAAVGTEHVDGYVLWLAPHSHSEPGYYAQTTLFTCGAVAALIAAEGADAQGFSGGAGDRDVEIGLWRRASNYPACEPVGLAVALRDHLDGEPVEVALDSDGPVLVEGYTGFDRSFREELQKDSLRQAQERGIPVRRDRVDIAEIATRVAGGERALLLIDEAPMHGETGPHWIVAHAVVGDAVVVEDPWINVEAGETWVDTHELPVLPAALEELVRWGAAGYRGVIFTRVG